MQLRHQIAQRTKVELVTAKGLHQQSADSTRFVEQQVLVSLRQLVDLSDRRLPRHQYHPGITAVVQQQHARQLEITDQVTIFV